MTTSDDTLRRAAAMLHRRFVLWWKPRNSKRWRRVGEYPNVVAAGTEMERRVQRGDGGTFRALAAGRDPTVMDEDDEDGDGEVYESGGPLTPVRPGAGRPPRGR